MNKKPTDEDKIIYNDPQPEKPINPRYIKGIITKYNSWGVEMEREHRIISIPYTQIFRIEEVKK